MALKYTTIDDLNRRLDGRLQIGGVVASLGESAISATLVEQLGEQVEAWIDGIIRKRYKLPLKNAHAVLAATVESGVTCQLFSQYFVGQSPAEGAPSDVGVCVEYRRQLKMLEAIALEGETLIEFNDQSQGFAWTTISAGDRDAPVQTVQW